MRNFIIGIVILVLSMLITLVTFVAMSWYHFGDVPTNIVLLRMIVFTLFVFIVMTLFVFFYMRKKRINLN